MPRCIFLGACFTTLAALAGCGSAAKALKPMTKTELENDLARW